MKAWLVVLPLLAGCALLTPNRSNDPKSCRERVAYRLAATYPDPVQLGIALDTVCEGNVPLVGPTTTRVP